jgi:hypothetical protein
MVLRKGKAFTVLHIHLTQVNDITDNFLAKWAAAAISS